MNIINNTKKFLNNRPVRLLFSLIIITAIMVGIYFAIVSLIKSTAPKCQHGTVEINGKCYNSECSNSCSIDKQTRDLSNPPLCPCSCPEDMLPFKNPSTDKLECVNTCGKHGLCSDPLDPKSCVWVNYNINDSSSNYLQCFDTLTDYTICDSLPEGSDSHYVACDKNHICSQSEDSVTYCHDTSPSPPSPSGNLCPTGLVNPCSSDDDCKDIYTNDPKSVSCIFENDWNKNNKIGYCDNSNHSKTEKQKNNNLVKNTTSRCVDKEKITKNSSGNWISCTSNENPCYYNAPNCLTGCCINKVCGQSGECLKSNEACTTDGTVCPINSLYDCNPPDDKDNCKKCCSPHQSVNNQCLNLCDYKSDIGNIKTPCTTDDDCGNEDIIKAYGTDSKVGAVCIQGNCQLACGPESQQGTSYSCANLTNSSDPSKNVSHCYKETNCQWEIPQPYQPALGTVPPTGGTINKIICNRDGDSNDLYWKPQSGQTQANYSRLMRSFINPNKDIDSSAVCNELDFHTFAENNSLQNLSSIKSVTYNDNRGNPYGLITSNCNQIIEHTNTEEFTDKYNSNDSNDKNNKNNFNSITDFENLSKKNIKTNDKFMLDSISNIPWIDGTFPTANYITPTWNNTGYFNNSSFKYSCINPGGKNSVTPEYCKYLSNSKYCPFGSFDGINCISENQTKLDYSNLCAVNSGTTTYPNNIECTMPYNSSSGEINRNYFCPTGNSNGFNSCCGIGGIITNKCANNGVCPECICTIGISKDSSGKCVTCNNMNFLDITRRLQPCTWLSGSQKLHYCDMHEGSKAQIFGVGDAETNVILLLKVKGSNPPKYLNLSSLNQNSQLEIVDESSRLNIFLRTAPAKLWSSSAGNHYSCLAYYDSNGYQKILQGVNGNYNNNGIVNKDHQNDGSTNIKGIALAVARPNEYVLWSPHISTAFDFKSGGHNVIYVQDNHGWCGKVNTTNNILEFNDEWDGDPAKPIGDGNPPTDITTFEIVLSLTDTGGDDHMIQKSGVYSKIKDLFDAQFINRTKNYTIGQILSMINK